MSFEFASPLLQSVFGILLWASLVGGAVTVVVWLLQNLMGRFFNPRLLYCLWILVVLRFVLFVVPGSPTSFLNLFSGPGVDHSVVAEQETLAVVTYANGTAIPNHLAEQAIRPVATSVSATDWTEQAWLVCQLVWLAVVLVMILRLAIQIGAIRRLTRNSTEVDSPRVRRVFVAAKNRLNIRRRVRLRCSDLLQAPAVVGCLRPIVLLPRWCESELSDSQLRIVFAHELVHVRRHDVLIQMLAHVVTLVHWFNPFVRYARNRIETYRELSCDEWVLQTFGDHDETNFRRQYGETILQIAEKCGREEWKQPGWMPGFIGIRGNLVSERIQMLGPIKKRSHGATFAGTVIVGLVIAVGFTAAQETTGEFENGSQGSISMVSPESKKPRGNDELPFKQLVDVTFRLQIFEGPLKEVDAILETCSLEEKKRNPEAPTFQFEAPARSGDQACSGIVSDSTRTDIQDRLDTIDLIYDSRFHGCDGETLLFKAMRDVGFSVGKRVETRALGISAELTPRWTNSRMTVSLRAEASDTADHLANDSQVPGFVVRRVNASVQFVARKECGVVRLTSTRRNANNEEEDFGVVFLFTPVEFESSKNPPARNRVSTPEPIVIPTTHDAKPVSAQEESTAEVIAYKLDVFRGETKEVKELIRKVLGSKFFDGDTRGHRSLGGARSETQRQFRRLLKNSSIELRNQPVMIAPLGQSAEFMSGKEVPIAEHGFIVNQGSDHLKVEPSAEWLEPVDFRTVGTTVQVRSRRQESELVTTVNLRYSRCATDQIIQVFNHDRQVFQDVPRMFESEFNKTFVSRLGETTVFCFDAGRVGSKKTDSNPEETILLLVTPHAVPHVAGKNRDGDSN